MMIVVRKLKVNEKLPLKTGSVFDEHPDPEMTWIAMDNGRPCGVLLGAKAHGTFFVMKIQSTLENAETGVRLFNAAIRDAKVMGLTHVTSVVNVNRPVESRIFSIAARIKEALFSGPIQGIWITVPMEAICHAQ
jgi:hypothetical protein